MKNIVIRYFMCRVGLDFHDSIVWQFMTVHTKFRADEVFGSVREYVGSLFDVLSMGDMEAAFCSSSMAKTFVWFSIHISLTTKQRCIPYSSP